MGRVMGWAAGTLCLAAAVAEAQEKVAWDKAEAALAKAQLTGKPIVWFFVNSEFTKDAGIVAPTTGTADLAFNHESVVKRRDKFLWVRGDQTLANRMKIRGAPMVRITDPEGDTIVDAPINGPEPLLTAMIAVLKDKYVDRPVQWGTIVRTGPIKTSFLVVAFDAPGGEALKLWEDRSLVKYHKMCDFVRLEAAKGSDIAKKWGVADFPTFVICDAQEKVLEKVSKKELDALDLRASMSKAWKKLEGRR